MRERNVSFAAFPFAKPVSLPLASIRGGVAGMERWDDGGDYFLSFSQAMERLKFAKIPSVNSFSKRKGDYLRNEK